MKPLGSQWTVLAAVVSRITARRPCSAPSPWRPAASAGRGAVAAAAEKGAAGHVTGLAGARAALGHACSTTSCLASAATPAVTVAHRPRPHPRPRPPLLRPRRSLYKRRKFLLEEIQGEGEEEEPGRRFRLRRSARLHMYVSELPCGDAAIFQLASPGRNGATSCACGSDGALVAPMNFTGAKLLTAREEVDDEGASATATATATTLQEKKKRARPNDDVKDASRPPPPSAPPPPPAVAVLVVAAVIRCWACASRGGRRWGHCGSSPCGPTRRRSAAASP